MAISAVTDVPSVSAAASGGASWPVAASTAPSSGIGPGPVRTSVTVASTGSLAWTSPTGSRTTLSASGGDVVAAPSFAVSNALVVRVAQVAGHPIETVEANRPELVREGERRARAAECDAAVVGVPRGTRQRRAANGRLWLAAQDTIADRDTADVAARREEVAVDGTNGP